MHTVCLLSMPTFKKPAEYDPALAEQTLHKNLQHSESAQERQKQRMLAELGLADEGMDLMDDEEGGSLGDFDDDEAPIFSSHGGGAATSAGKCLAALSMALQHAHMHRCMPPLSCCSMALHMRNHAYGRVHVLCMQMTHHWAALRVLSRLICRPVMCGLCHCSPGSLLAVRQYASSLFLYICGQEDHVFETFNSQRLALKTELSTPEDDSIVWANAGGASSRGGGASASAGGSYGYKDVFGKQYQKRRQQLIDIKVGGMSRQRWRRW